MKKINIYKDKANFGKWKGQYLFGKPWYLKWLANNIDLTKHFDEQSCKMIMGYKNFKYTPRKSSYSDSFPNASCNDDWCENAGSFYGSYYGM